MVGGGLFWRENGEGVGGADGGLEEGADLLDLVGGHDALGETDAGVIGCKEDENVVVFGESFVS